MIEQVHIGSWIGKELIELLSNIYIYIPLMLIGFIIIIRNNSVKSCLLVFVSILCLMFSIHYTLGPIEALFGGQVNLHSSMCFFTVFSAITVFISCLFRNRSFFITSLVVIGIAIGTLPEYFKEHLFGIIISVLEALILYGIYLLISKKFLTNRNTWVSQQFTHSGYALTDILLLNNVIVLTAFIILIIFLFKMVI